MSNILPIFTSALKAVVESVQSTFSFDSLTNTTTLNDKLIVNGDVLVDNGSKLTVENGSGLVVFEYDPATKTLTIGRSTVNGPHIIDAIGADAIIRSGGDIIGSGKLTIPRAVFSSTPMMSLCLDADKSIANNVATNIHWTTIFSLNDRGTVYDPVNSVFNNTNLGLRYDPAFKIFKNISGGELLLLVQCQVRWANMTTGGRVVDIDYTEDAGATLYDMASVNSGSTQVRVQIQAIIKMANSTNAWFQVSALQDSGGPVDIVALTGGISKATNLQIVRL